MGLLDDKTAVVTGGARGIGLAVGQAFFREGANVVLADVDAAGAEAAVAELDASATGRVMGAPVDVTDEASTEALADAV
jgi:3-oxoacyl-[acyl-carrier protein] reductase